MSNNADMFAHWALRLSICNIEYLDNPIGLASSMDQLAYQIAVTELKKVKTDDN